MDPHAGHHDEPRVRDAIPDHGALRVGYGGAEAHRTRTNGRRCGFCSAALAALASCSPVPSAAPIGSRLWLSSPGHGVAVSAIDRIAAVLDRIADRLDDLDRRQEAQDRAAGQRDEVITAQQATIHDLVIRSRLVTADHDGELGELARRMLDVERRQANGHDAE